MNIGIITQKLGLKTGDIVCATKIDGANNEKLKPGNQFVGQLEEEITVGKHVIVSQVSGSRGLETSTVTSVYESFNSMLVKTKNSTYLLEKIPA